MIILIAILIVFLLICFADPNRYGTDYLPPLTDADRDRILRVKSDIPPDPNPDPNPEPAPVKVYRDIPGSARLPK